MMNRLFSCFILLVLLVLLVAGCETFGPEESGVGNLKAEIELTDVNETEEVMLNVFNSELTENAIYQLEKKDKIEKIFADLESGEWTVEVMLTDQDGIYHPVKQKKVTITRETTSEINLTIASREFKEVLDSYEQLETSLATVSQEDSNEKYRIINRNSNMLMEVEENAVTNGANVQQGSDLNSEHQYWEIFRGTEGNFSFRNVNSDQVLDIENDSDKNGANVIQNDYSSSEESQHWAIVHREEGYYAILNVNSEGKGLDVEGGKTESGTNIHLWGYWGGENQQFSIEQVDEEDDQQPNFSMVGFATENGGTTGGQNGETITVDNGNDLQQAISEKGSEPLTIYVEGTINSENSDYNKISVKDVSDVSILGKGNEGVFDGVGIKIWRADNIIVRNLKIHHVRADAGEDCIGIEGPANNIWIDHNELYNDYDDVDKDYYDGLLDVKKDSEYITISWNYLHDSWKTSLVGSADSDDHNRRITYHHNFFQNCNSRLPSYRHGEGHLFNNYYQDIHSTAINSRMGAELLIENNYFENVSNPIGSWFSDEEGFWDVSDNKFINIDGDMPADSTCSYDPPYDYSSVLDSVDDVKSIVTDNAGVGVISP
ncbi:MAG: RICIN domain-containing protein [Halanaerobiaceae bacterium]